MELLLGGAVLLTLLFAFCNGFHDTSTTVVNAVQSRALTPRWALVVVTLFNFIGALLGQGIADRIGSGIVEMPEQAAIVLVMLICALAAAVLWNIVTYVAALPMSSTHALIGGLLGSGFVFGSVVHPEVLVTGVIGPLLLSPLLAFLLALVLTRLVSRLVSAVEPKKLFARTRGVQAVSTSALGLAHGIQDAQKSAAVMMIALTAYSTGAHALAEQPPTSWPVRVTIAAVLALGTWYGGWRITRTLGEKVARIDPVQRVVADTGSNALLFLAAFVFRAPISLTFTVGSAIFGAAVAGHRPIRLRYAAPVVICWLISAPASALLAAGMALAARAAL
ncbi:inorganic phosphate transporter [Sediminivirga luteola]|uniref:Inorganic phosphate transporter n=1 Tax=Sediminivirga luteola TaxID=1774748 RepID=A0A8J2TXT5_9MICO|nr:inorganic phosphate transporter [Sediminivirga luteola]GGA13829.1 inorganic phosphate transporter [Sediminivirga luteola]